MVTMTTVDRKAALAAVQRAGKAASTRPGIPALSGVRVVASPGRLELTCTDLELTVRTYVDAEGGSWSALVPWKILRDALKASTAAAVELTYDGLGFVRIGSTTVRCLPLEDFPTLEIPTADEVLDGQEYLRAVATVLPACSHDDGRPILTGVLHESGVMVATDSYRLHVAELPIRAGDRATVIPGRALKVLAAIAGKRYGAGIGFRAGDTSAVWHLQDGTAVMVRVIEGEYPRWRTLVPDEADATGRVTFDTATMLGALAGAAVTSRDTTPVRLELNGYVRMTSSAPDLGETTLELEGATWNGPDMTAAYNPGYLADAVAAVAADRMDVRDTLKPAVARGPYGIALVMPVRLPAAVS